MGRFNLQTRLMMLCALLLAVTAVVGVSSYISSDGVSQKYESLVASTLPKRAKVHTMYEHFLIIRMNLRNLGLPGISKEQTEESLKLVSESIKAIEDDQKDYESYGFDPGQRELYDQQQIEFKAFLEVGKRVLAHNAAGTPEDRAAMTKIFFNDCPSVAAKYTEATHRLIDFHTKVLGQSSAAAATIAKNGTLINIFVMAIGMFVGLVVAFLFARSLSKSLSKISESMSRTATQTSLGADQLSGASGQLSSASTQAAASLEETVASLEELSSMVKLNSGAAQQANSLSQKSRESAENGDIEISKLITAMSQIAQGSKKIEEIINVIDDIAFQTNLLALNASVEAARAGEQGKGFAVVAEAVRSLAQRSAVAAKDISTLIKENVERSEHGSRIADQSSTVLKEILSSVKKVADLNSEIATGSQEQAHGLEQISKAMNQLDQATQGNAASSEEVAAFSQQMAQQGLTLSSLVKDLQKIAHGARELDKNNSAPTKKEKEASKILETSAATSGKKSKTNGAAVVHKLKSAPKKAATTSHAIPFDDDGDQNRSVGDVSGF